MGLKINHLEKNYKLNNQNLTILKDLNAEIKNSEVVAILGSSGSGKSTLLSLLAGLDSPDKGSIYFDESDIAKLNQQELTKFRAENIGIIFQNFYLVSHLNAFENVKLPMTIQNKNVSKEEITHLLESVGLGHRLEHSPKELSGGESQRLAIARALITKPKLLLADEPSGSLDTETGKKVMDLFFNQVRQNKTMTILVTHDRKVADQCDRILVLDKGQLWSA